MLQTLIDTRINLGLANMYVYNINDTFLRFFDCLAHPNLSATLATDQKWP